MPSHAVFVYILFSHDLTCHTSSPTLVHRTSSPTTARVIARAGAPLRPLGSAGVVVGEGLERGTCEDLASEHLGKDDVVRFIFLSWNECFYPFTLSDILSWPHILIRLCYMILL